MYVDYWQLWDEFFDHGGLGLGLGLGGWTRKEGRTRKRDW